MSIQHCLEQIVRTLMFLGVDKEHVSLDEGDVDRENPVDGSFDNSALRG